MSAFAASASALSTKRAERSNCMRGAGEGARMNVSAFGREAPGLPRGRELRQRLVERAQEAERRVALGFEHERGAVDAHAQVAVVVGREARRHARGLGGAIKTERERGAVAHATTSAVART